MKVVPAAVGLALVLGSMVAEIPERTARADDESPWLTADVQRRLDDIRARYAIPGVALSILLPGEPTPRSFVSGTTLRDPAADGSEPVTLEHLFQIGGITKTMTAAVMLMLEADALLSLDHRIADHLPEYPDWKDVTVRQLLNMTSGITDYSSIAAFVPAVQTQPYRQWSARDLVALAYTNTPNTWFAPGGGWEYSNTNYVLAGLIVERVTGDPFAAVLQRRVLGWSGARLLNSYYLPEPYPSRVMERMVHGYNRNGIYPNDTDVTGFNPSWADAAGAEVSNTVDIVTWIQALFGGKLLPPAQMADSLLSRVMRPTTMRECSRHRI